MPDYEWRFGVVGNIVKQHLDSEGIVRYGTKAFVGGTKVYLDGKNFFNYPRTEIEVIGLNRFHRYAIESVPLDLIENVRFQIIRKPIVLRILADQAIMEGWNWYGTTAADKRDAMDFVEEWKKLCTTKTEL